jgi:phage terminase large subunit
MDLDKYQADLLKGQDPYTKGKKKKTSPDALSVRPEPTNLNINAIAADKNHPLHYANIFNPDDYEEIVEKYNPDISDINTLDLWGKFVPTFYQYEWYEFFNQVDKNGNLIKHLDGISILHRRAGKTVGVFKCVILPRMLARRGTYVHVFPSLVQGRAVMWNGIGAVTRDPNEQPIPYLELIPKKLWKKKDNQNMTLELINGSIYKIVGIRGPDGTANHLRGLAAEGVIADEYPEWPKGAFQEVFTPILAQNGGFSLKIGTPKGHNHAHKDYIYCKANERTNLKAWLYTIDDTYYNGGERIITKEYVDEEIARGMDVARARAEFYCDFDTSIGGTWYADQIDILRESGRFQPLTEDKSKPVYLGFDLGEGVDHTVALAFQVISEDRINILKKYSIVNKPMAIILAQAARDYKIAALILPHDGKRRQDRVDFLESRATTLRNKGFVVVNVAKTANVENNIEASKEILMKCYIDSQQAASFIEDLTYYSREQDSEGRYLQKAKHNEYSHGCDAFRTIATAIRTKKLPNLQRHQDEEFIRSLPTKADHSNYR